MVVEIINTGTELLLGSVVNTHLRYLAEALLPLGLHVSRQVTVPDGDAIRESLLDSFSRADIVIVTGGLGPTTDDMTREIAAELLGRALVHDASVMHAIEERYAQRGTAVSPRVDRQALRPQGAVVLPNQNGTAPGLYFPSVEIAPGEDASSQKSPHLFLLPGPPRELYPMFAQEALPILRQITPREGSRTMRTWRIASLGESQVEERVGERLLALGIELGYCAHPSEVDLRVIGSDAQIAEARTIIQHGIHKYIVSEDGTNIEQAVVRLLTERSQTISTAESCTGGFIAHRITNVPGASAVFRAGYVTYSNEAKTQTLGVNSALIREHGAVSHQVAAAMAEGAMGKAEASYALATTGIAGPDGGTPEKPVGTVYIALAIRDKSIQVQKHRFVTDRATFKDFTSLTALDFLRRTILEL